MENVQVYRVRFDDAGTAVAKNEARVVTQETNAEPAATTPPQ
jgi:soluble lytic murein transglycosylase